MNTPNPGPPANAQVQLVVDTDQRLNQLWGVPLIGIAIRALLVLPQAIWVSILGFVVGLTVIVSWAFVLITGRMPRAFIDLYVMTYRWTVRLSAYVLLMAAPYPGFSLSTPYPVDLEVNVGEEINRLWGIPFLGILVRGLLVIPHWIVTFVLGVLAYLVVLVAWIPVLLTGRFPSWGYAVLGGYLRVSTRMTMYTLLVPMQYPPLTVRS